MPEKVTSGQKLKANPLIKKSTTINQVLEATEYYQRQIAFGKGVTPASFTHPLLKVKNVTGGDLARGSVLQLGAALLSEVDPLNLWFEADDPAEPLTRKLVILVNPLKSNKIGPAYGSGVAIALVDVQATTDTHAFAVDGSTVLDSGSGGPLEILSSPSSTGEQLLAVRFSGNEDAYDMIQGNLTAAMTGANATRNIDNIIVMKGRDPRTDSTSTSETVEVHNIFGFSGDDNGLIVAKWNKSTSRWEIIQAECPA